MPKCGVVNNGNFTDTNGKNRKFSIHSRNSKVSVDGHEIGLLAIRDDLTYRWQSSQQLIGTVKDLGPIITFLPRFLSGEFKEVENATLS